VRDILVLALLAAGFALAGCGSGTTTQHGPPHTGAVTVLGTTTIAHMPTGTPVHCKDGQGAAVPPPGQGVVGFADGRNSSGEIKVTHRADGSVVASCRSG
jgi:hypothetical protein